MVNVRIVLDYRCEIKEYRMLITDLQVYNKLFNLAVLVSEYTLKFPRFEMFELGSQLRRSSNSALANLAEGFGNKRTNIFTEAISWSQGEVRETTHHLSMAFAKQSVTEFDFKSLLSGYEECSKMLYGLEKSLIKNHKS